MSEPEAPGALPADVDVIPAAPPRRRFFWGRDLLLLWLGQVVSGLGDSLVSMGFVFLVLEMTGDERALGGFQSVAYLPIVLFGLAAGVYVDRRDRRRVMLAADLGRAIILASLPLAAMTGILGIGYAGVAVVISSVCMTFFNPAYNSALPVIVDDPSKLFGVNAVMQSSRQFASIIGPGLAAYGMAQWGPLTLLSANSVIYLLSFLCVYFIAHDLRSTSVKGAISLRELRSEIAAGLRAVRGTRGVRELFAFTLANNVLLMGPALVATPLLVTQVFKGTMADFAMIQLMYACGMAITSLVMHRLPPIRTIGILWAVGMMLDGFTFVIYLFADTLPLLYAAAFVHALVVPFLIIPRTTIMQRKLPPEMLGRAFGYVDIAVLGVTSLSALIAGFVIKEIGPLETMVWGGGTAGVVGLVALGFRSIREIRFDDHAVEG